MKDNILLTKYHVEIDGNFRVIFAELPEKCKRIVQGFREQRREVEDSYYYPAKKKRVKVSYLFFYRDDKKSAYVKFSLHRFKNDMLEIEACIIAAIEKLLETGKG